MRQKLPRHTEQPREVAAQRGHVDVRGLPDEVRGVGIVDKSVEQFIPGCARQQVVCGLEEGPPISGQTMATPPNALFRMLRTISWCSVRDASEGSS